MFSPRLRSNLKSVFFLYTRTLAINMVPGIARIARIELNPHHGIIFRFRAGERIIPYALDRFFSLDVIAALVRPYHVKIQTAPPANCNATSDTSSTCAALING